MAKQSEFEKIKQRLADAARPAAEQAALMAAYAQGQLLTRDELNQAMADWQPPADAELDRRAAQELAAGRDHARHLADLAELARRDQQRGVDRLTENLERARAAVDEQADERDRQEQEAQRLQAEIDALPEPLRDIRPSGSQAQAYAQAAEARGTAGGAEGSVG